MPDPELVPAVSDHAAAETLLARLRTSLVRLQEADIAFAEYIDEDDPWTRDDPQPYFAAEDLSSDDERDRLSAFEAAWTDTYTWVRELEALGYAAQLTETDCEPDEAFGLTFAATFEREVNFGPLVLAHWQVHICGEAQQGSSGFMTYVSEDDHDLPDVFFQRLGLERTHSDFPCDDDEACAMFGLDDDDDEAPEDA